MAAKRTHVGVSDGGRGCAPIVGIIILILLFTWPLIAFRHSWTTNETVSCSTNPDGSNCSYDPFTKGYTGGTWTDTTTHSGVTAAGCIVEAVWVGLLVGGFLLLGATSSAKKKRRVSSLELVTPLVAGEWKAGYDVVDPIPSANSGDNSTVYPDHVVRFSSLDESSRQLLIRAQRAIHDVLTCKIYAENQLRQVATEPTLRRHEWAIAVNLREVASLRAEQARMRKSRPVESPGPLTKAVLGAQQDALHQKLKAVESLVKALENYAAHVKAADLARLDWEAATELAELNPRFSNLVAGTAADELHLQEVHDMTDEATTFHDSLLRANLAAEPLLLPDV